MAFIVETGNGSSTSNAYASVTFVDEYHQERGHHTWVAATHKKQQAIIGATDYIEKRFGVRFRGSRRTRDQGLQWPRIGARDNGGWDLDLVPRQLKQACAEYALRVLESGELAPDPEDDAPGAITGKREKVGPIEEETTYDAGGGRAPLTSLVSSDSIQEYPAADLLLEELLRGANSRRLIRG